MKKGITALIIGFLLSFNAFNAEASMVSFFVIETGLPMEGATNQHSQRWESAFMDVFFDEGHIVSNSPIQRLFSKSSDDILREISLLIEEAKDGGVDYVLVTQLDFNADAVPCGISFFIYRVTSQEKVFERRFTGKSYRSSRDEVDDLKTIARELVPYMSE